jgi:outer membrane lipoprotein carrier protein
MPRFLLPLLGLLLPLAAGAADGPSEYFNDLQALRADFSQTVYDERGEVLEQAAGRMYMQRPGRLRWDYRSPYRQQVVADGTRVWLYDEGLEQVTVQPLNEVLSATPLALLSGNDPLESVFDIESLSARGQLTWYRLQPLQPQAELNTLRLGFAQGNLQVLEMEDGLRRRTRIALANVERNPDLDPMLFRFEPPPGVDVIGLDQ